MNVITPLNMSHLIHSDAPLSPLSDWDHSQQYSPTSLEFPPSLHYNYHALPSPTRSVGSTSSGSPIPVSRVLRGRMSPDELESEPLCLPTHQVFDMSYAPSPEVFSSPASVQDQLPHVEQPSTGSVIPCKRSSSITPSACKKPRGAMSTKDFIPPDVTGLSKREARLVKNRAAAFLSRQRKREEFETMELRVAELEQENARLLALAQGGATQEQPQELLSEVEQLRAQLAAAQRREQELADALSRNAASPARSSVKSETFEPQLSLTPPRNPGQLLHKSSASLGLMVLLCALPTLLSLPTHSTVPTTVSLPLSHPSAIQAASSAFDMNSLVTGDFDWLSSAGSVMDLDIDSLGRITPGAAVNAGSLKKLEFVDADAEALGLSGLDISFDATPSQDGKIRVRIHPPTAADAQAQAGADDDQSMWCGSDMGSSAAGSPGSFGADADPFLGVGGDYGMAMAAMDTGMNAGFTHPHAAFDYDTAAAFGTATPAGRRRVRIALKSMPGEGREGGEWEVQLC